MEESAYMFYQLIFIVSDFSPNTIYLGKIRKLKNKRMQHIHRTDRSRHMLAVMKYKCQPAGKRNPGCQ